MQLAYPMAIYLHEAIIHGVSLVILILNQQKNRKKLLILKIYILYLFHALKEKNTLALVALIMNREFLCGVAATKEN